MAEWRKTDLGGTIEFIGWNPSRAETLVTRSQQSADLIFGGLEGETHSGITRPSCSRVTNLFAKETPIFNSRQLSVLSTEEIEEIATAMGVPSLDPAWVGANLVIQGIPQLSLLPPASRLQFESGATIVVSVLNGPCKYPAMVIAETYPDQGKFFPKASYNKRGFTGFVEREGPISLGMKVAVFVPDQPAHPMLGQ